VRIVARPLPRSAARPPTLTLTICLARPVPPPRPPLPLLLPSAVYSAALQFVYATRAQPVRASQYVFGDKSWVTFIEDHKRPAKGKTYAINEGSSGNWCPVVSALVAQHLRGRSVRWMCCMVADVHRQLLEGGCFLYPSDTQYPKGRLRLIYEAIPLAFIWERAGAGAALTTVEGERVLSRPLPADIHARCGILFLGDAENKALESVRAHNPLWAGGVAADKSKLDKQHTDAKVVSELSMLRVALVLGAVFNIALLLRSRS
jgi:hypothetical protein